VAASLRFAPGRPLTASFPRQDPAPAGRTGQDSVLGDFAQVTLAIRKVFESRILQRPTGVCEIEMIGSRTSMATARIGQLDLMNQAG
jgi:hypothetical protein